MKRLPRNMMQQFRWAAATLLIVLLLLLCIFMVAGCSDDDEAFPPYQQQLCELVTDSQGRAVKLRSDDGKEHIVVNPIGNLTPDSIYRVSAVITEHPDGVSLHGLSSVPAPFPRLFKNGTLRTDPVEVLTAWRVERYLNLRLAITVGNEAVHTLGFAEKGTITHPNGKRTRLLTLHHDSNADGQYYRNETCVSCPLYKFPDDIDSVSLSVVTYSQPFILTIPL